MTRGGSMKEILKTIARLGCLLVLSGCVYEPTETIIAPVNTVVELSQTLQPVTGEPTIEATQTSTPPYTATSDPTSTLTLEITDIPKLSVF